ncbi:hypothetical protein Pan189_26690 [Stratiformator vulcanicus]|uniref:Uncharacterized protein n=2 Tax=Stratiformator vulcanicus TaxID=2527980 RepID=A0A517R320_9PLAN|nr:hypothetical protein Pan189_26690 [Stratiformator vulcanicus]
MSALCSWRRGFGIAIGPAVLCGIGCDIKPSNLNEPAEPAPAAAVPDQPDKKDDVAVIHKTTREILDLAELQDDPNWAVVDTGVTGGDPLTQAQSVYFHAAATLSPIPIQQFVQQQRALEGTTPTYEEVQQFMEQNPGVTLRQQKPWQKYAYDAENGTIVVVEDKAEKQRISEKAGVELD